MNKLFVYGSLKDIDLFEFLFDVTPKKVSNSQVNGELYQGEWYPFYLHRSGRIVYGKTLFFDELPESLLMKLDQYEQVQEGVFSRRAVNNNVRESRTVKSFVYEANMNHRDTRKFITPTNLIVEGNFEVTARMLEEARKYKP